MAQYKPNSDSFNQLLLKLDEHGARANFIDEVLRREKELGDNLTISVRVDGRRSSFEILLFAFTWDETIDGHVYWSDIYKKIGGACV